MISLLLARLRQSHLHKPDQYGLTVADAYAERSSIAQLKSLLVGDFFVVFVRTLRYRKEMKPPFPYDRPLSHSQLSTWEWRKTDWWDKYVLGKEKEPSAEMIFGKEVDLKIQQDPTYLPAITRLPHLQYELKNEFQGIPLIGFPDALDLDNPHLIDYKTGRKPWDKKRADETKQLTMYLTQIYLLHGIKPKEFRCSIQWMPTHIKDGAVAFISEGEVITIETNRTMTDILKFMQYLIDTRKEMEEYYKNYVSNEISEDEFFHTK